LSIEALSKAFDKENDVRRRVVKPMNAKDQVNDGQTQRTEQTMVSSAAVRTGHTASDSPEENKHILGINKSIFPRIPLILCYNKFLEFHNLPLISLNNPTLYSFLLHIIKYSSDLKFKISVDIQQTETHIYNNIEDPILPQHKIILPSDYYTYYHLPIRSNNLHTHINNNLFLENNISSSPSPTPPYQSHNNSNTLTLNIATHNVQGYNTLTKRQLWEEYCLENNLHITSITETKIALNKSNKFFNTNNFTYYWSCLDNSAEGTAIMINNSLKSHIHKILCCPGGAIAIDLYFKHDFKFRIISTYLSSTNSSNRHNTQQKVTQWIQQALSINLHPIILGDFNISPNINNPLMSKTPIISFLHNNNMYDLADHTNNTQHTWESSRYKSRIDYIWAHDTIIPYLTNFSLIDSSNSTNSDHCILVSQWEFPFAFSNRLHHKNKSKRRIFNYKLMTTEKWEEFSDKVNGLLNLHKTPISTDTADSLEKTWHQIQTCIIQAAFQIIPNKKFTVRNFHHTFTPKATAIHNDLKIIGNIISKTKYSLQHSSPIPNNIATLIQHINETHNFQIDLPPTDISLLPLWIANTKAYWKTLYNARNIENTKVIQQHINTAIQTRCERLSTHPTKMINSILNRHTDSVHFDNIKTDTSIITEPNDIKSHIQDHFEKWTSHRPFDQHIFNSTWQNDYLPRPDINTNWYSLALNQITPNEVLSTINQLPNNKACGPSGISYEMLKHIGHQALLTITSLFNRCLNSSRIPKQWKDGRIFPISKKSTFDGNLNNTRPISLIEHIKKIYTKILTNRLNKIFTTHSILNPHNYVALPGNSTNIPIHILNNLIEDATCNGKELWLLSQDMSKAYDSVNLELFTRALHRINMPYQLIQILTNLLTNRSNQVITNFGLTASYQVQDGIDQGETITPLFWRIFYDPLIHKISSTYSGYTMSTTWSKDISILPSHKLQTSTSVLAYMDDTLWITNSLSQLQQILQVAESFYKMARIQVNPTKSTLLSNSKLKPQLLFMDSTIHTQPNNTALKFLGCWFTINQKYNIQTKLILQEIFDLCNILQTKNITDKQTSYIINNVIIPIFEYRIHNIVLPQYICNKILSKYLTIAKHKAKLSKTTPNSTMLNHNIYGIKNVWDIQLQHHTSNFLNRINNQDLLGTTTHIRLQHLQNNLWSTTNILQHPNPVIDGLNKNTTTFKIILLFKYLNLTITTNSNLSTPHTINSSHTPIEQFLSSDKSYSIFKQQLRSKRILFLEQLTSADNTTLLLWNHISPRLNYLPKGKQPKWFSIIENRITINNTTRQIISDISLPTINSLSFQTGHYKTKKNTWLITYSDNNIIIGKARRFNIESNTISITHWLSNIDPNITSLYPTPEIECRPCSGCNLNSNRIQNNCTLNISATLSTKFLGRRVYNSTPNKLNLHANYLDLLYSIALRNPSSAPSSPTIHINQSPVLEIFNSNLASAHLNQLANNNISQNNFTFYTDGSVRNISTEQCSMGIGWIQIYNNSPIQNYSAQILNWPSSYKAELIAILSAICTCPRNSNIDIYTDSQSVTSKYSKLTSSTLPSNKTYSYNYWPIWHTILNLIKSYSYKLTFHKVTAHSDNIFNNLANNLAQQHQNSFTLLFNHNNIYNPSFSLQYETYNIEQPFRRTIKNICNAHVVAMWSSQHRMNNIITRSKNINWNATWLFLNNNHKRSYNYTNFQLSSKKSFRIKNLLHILPTLSYSHNLYPSLFLNINCITCNQHEQPYHWITCPNNNKLLSIIHNAIINTINLASLEISNNQLQNLHHLLIHHYCLSFSQLPNLTSTTIYTTLQGFIPEAIIEIISQYSTLNNATQLCIKLLSNISDEIYEQLWKPYCTKFSEWKTTNNIPKHPTSQRKTPQAKRSYSYKYYTYNCTCGLPDQQHDEINQTCPPLGQARKKIDIWIQNWIQYSMPTNSILNIQI
jgi:ribonuclease HI/endonuclease/exonuclease/phosphatase family metal-dependent hydrolase